MKIVPIAFAFDNNLILPACVCISSLLMSAKENTFYDIFILYSERSGLKHNEIDKISTYYSNCRIQYRSVGNVFDEAFEVRGITTPAYYRLLIPELVPEYDKIIYSDVDVIYRMDLSNLFKMDLEDNYIAATYDLGLCLSLEGKKYTSSVEGLMVGNYIQSGFIIINSKKILSDNLIFLFKKFAKKKLRYQDQDILNIVCKNRIKIIPNIYNLTDQAFYYLEKETSLLQGKYEMSDIKEVKKIGTIHFNGAKPWKKYCVNFDLWWEYYRKSPFYDSTYYFDFFYSKLDEYDRLSLLKRVKILLRYFFYKR